ncbi:tRNA pseudouridine(38-40) synthase TruA [Bacillus kwashiorkori]|uniref:tRNA pseudouridine(38-40) synthase TruA n=1 Tax=Bacillus kwashiorkori TaxID=1522318 RepID=UPI0007836B3D|nr:tRNA pseudouridine(38-40) synthase TruA [Bacillus kwashiorkori]
MERMKCIVAYDGTNFAGFQIQPNVRTIQGEIEKVLAKMHRQEVRIHASGRTDGKVHAVGQVFHFDSNIHMQKDQWKRALNSMLPEDIVISSVEFVSTEFHARFSATAKEYHYKVSLKKDKDPFMRNYAYHFPYSLDLLAMNEAIGYLLGEHDFSSFCSAKTSVTDHIRTIYHIDLQEQNGELIFQIKGNGFLYNMVRIIVGTVLEVGIGARKAEEIPIIIAKKDRAFAGKTAPGHGLYLMKVDYY